LENFMSSDPAAPDLSGHTLRIAGIVIVAIAAIIVIAGIAMRTSDAARLRERADAQAVPTVVVVAPGNAGPAATLDLPGRLEAYSRAPIYARVSGYLKSWKVDIGTPVKAGQLLAEIETPDLDQQLLQAKADLASAQANAALAATTAKRWQSLFASDSVSRQEAEEKSGDYATKQAMVNAAQANVDRVAAMKNFTRIVAPFDGIVTARSTDVGALINAGSGAGPELFVVSDTKKTSRLCQCAAELRVDHQTRHQGQNQRAGTPGKILYRDGRILFPGGQHRIGQHADTAWGRQCQRGIAARRVRQREPRTSARHRRIQHPAHRTHIRQGGTPRRHRWRRQQGHPETRHHRA
jgi:multidrug efflux pump subunit AcrA (membrane-fusion protein)